MFENVDLSNLDPVVAVALLIVVLVIAGMKFVEWISPQKNKEKNGVLKLHESPCGPLIQITTMFDSFAKAQTETMANIHNGLNSNARAVKEIETRFGDEMTAMGKEITRLATIIEERIPKKGA